MFLPSLSFLLLIFLRVSEIASGFAFQNDRLLICGRELKLTGVWCKIRSPFKQET